MRTILDRIHHRIDSSDWWGAAFALFVSLVLNVGPLLLPVASKAAALIAMLVVMVILLFVLDFMYYCGRVRYARLH